jgi:hypothetical protein
VPAFACASSSVDHFSEWYFCPLLFVVLLQVHLKVCPTNRLVCFWTRSSRSEVVDWPCPFGFP